MRMCMALVLMVWKARVCMNDDDDCYGDHDDKYGNGGCDHVYEGSGVAGGYRYVGVDDVVIGCGDDGDDNVDTTGIHHDDDDGDGYGNCVDEDTDSGHAGEGDGEYDYVDDSYAGDDGTCVDGGVGDVVVDECARLW